MKIIDASYKSSAISYFDESKNEVRGKCKLKPNKPYFVFEIREEKGKLNLVGGSPEFTV